MPWYYSGPEAKPVGPVSLEELHAKRLAGAISSETYVIESGEGANEAMAWKRYREVFPSSAVAPPVLMTAPIPPPIQPPLPVNQPPAVARHPLFPSAGATVHHPAQTPFSPPGPSPTVPHAPSGKSNTWCRWGFGLSLASFILLIPTCGLGSLLALPGLILSFGGLMQVHQHRGESGQGLAIVGLLLSSFVLIATLILLAVAVPYYIQHHDQTATEESTNDSQ